MQSSLIKVTCFNVPQIVQNPFYFKFLKNRKYFERYTLGYNLKKQINDMSSHLTMQIYRDNSKERQRNAVIKL